MEKNIFEILCGLVQKWDKFVHLSPIIIFRRIPFFLRNYTCSLYEAIVCLMVKWCLKPEPQAHFRYQHNRKQSGIKIAL